MLKFKYLTLLICFVFLSACTQGLDQKINGISFVASPKELIQDHVTPVQQVNANYASVMPFGFIRSLSEPEIQFDTDRQWFGETQKGAKQYIDLLHQNNINVMLKPQIWIWHGEFTGYLKMKSEEDWLLLEKSYRDFILTFAKLAAELNVAILCIGTELEQFIVNRPDYWKNLINEIKAQYKGELTYAANWDEYKRVPFWESLDYIGVDAYFPISENKTPTIEEAKRGWETWKSELEGISVKHDKRILFAEYGYRSVDYSGKEPWRSERSMSTVNLQAQTNLSRALFEELWNEEWMAGGFIWKWFIEHNNSGGKENSQFTPQNKPAEEILRQAYEVNN